MSDRTSTEKPPEKAFHLQATALKTVQDYLKVIEQKKALNAFAELFAEEARHNAAILDQKIAQGKAGKLAGMVIGIKDNICYAGHRVSAASKILQGYVSPFSATVVQRLLDEDALIMGRLNCDEFGMGATNENSFYGPVLNHSDKNKVSGGSSGGSAVSVQAGMCYASLGTDTGGSVRQPAAFCGVTGFKPTYGSLSRHGILAYASSFDQVGTITRSVDDAELMFSVMNGPDGRDSTLAHLQTRPSDLDARVPKKIAVLKEALEAEALEPDMKTALQTAIVKLKNEGHSVDLVDFPLLDHVVPTYYILAMAEASSNLSRYDGMHYGHRSAKAATLEETYKLSRSEGFGKEVQKRIMLGTFILSAGYYDAYYKKAQKVRRLISESTMGILSSYDFILQPSAQGAAFAVGDSDPDPVKMYLGDIFTVQASLSGLPAISLPAGNNQAGLPLGLQLTGRRNGDYALLDFAKYFSTLLEN